MVYNKHEWQDGELITKDKLSNIENYLASVSSSVFSNVLNFGADNTGVLDSTQAFKDAINNQVENARGAVFIPNGTYLITDTIIPNGVDIIGENEWETIILLKSPVGFILNDEKITNFTIDLTQSPENVEAVQLGGMINSSFSGGTNSLIENIYFMASFNQPKTVGISSHPNSTLASDVKDVWGNNVRNVLMRSIGTGIKLVAGSYGFVNGNLFDSILIKGFYENGILLDSDSSTAFPNQRNLFKHVQVQANGNYAIKDAVAFNIKHGSGNVFDDVTEWNDTGGVDDIVSINFGSSPASLVLGDIINNKFVNSKFEHKVTGSSWIIALNEINSNIINFSQSSYFGGTPKYYNIYDNSKFDNLLDRDIIYSEIINPGNNGLSLLNKTGTSINKYGSEITLGDNSSVSLSLSNNTVGRVFLNKFVTVSYSVSTSKVDGVVVNPTLDIKLPTGSPTSIAPIRRFTTSTDTGYDIHCLYSLSFVGTNYLAINSVITANLSLSGNNSFGIGKVRLSNFPVVSMSRYKDVVSNSNLLKSGNNMLRVTTTAVQKSVDNGTTWTNI